jgi:hypothetical protein
MARLMRSDWDETASFSAVRGGCDLNFCMLSVRTGNAWGLTPSDLFESLGVAALGEVVVLVFFGDMIE